MQGIAQALWEEAVYDEQGTLVSGSFVDYTLPTSADTISFVTDNTVSPSTTNDLGAKGVGELPMDVVAPAVVDAIHDAVGVWITELPATSERVLGAMLGRSAGRVA